MQVAEILAALCALEVPQGLKIVMAAMSDFRVAFDENFRFETLIASLRLPDSNNTDVPDNDYAFGADDVEAWDARRGVMLLVNALTTYPESLEDRVMLREEFGRRGLNEVMVVCQVLIFCPICQ